MSKEQPTREEVEAEIAALEKVLTDLKTDPDKQPYWSKGQHGSHYKDPWSYERSTLMNKIEELKKLPVMWPDICHRFRAWRGERGLRDIEPLFPEHIGIWEIAMLERGKIDHLSTEDIALIESVIAKKD